MSFTVLEAEPSLNKYLYYFVSYLYHCCSKRFHNSHIAASFQVILKENRQQIYIKQWNCLVKSEAFLYKSINFRNVKTINNSCRSSQETFSTFTEASPSDPPPTTASSNTVLLSPIKDFPDSELPTDRNGEAEVFEKQQMTQKRRRRSWRDQQMTPERIMRSLMRRQKSSCVGEEEEVIHHEEANLEEATEKDLRNCRGWRGRSRLRSWSKQKSSRREHREAGDF